MSEYGYRRGGADLPPHTRLEALDSEYYSGMNPYEQGETPLDDADIFRRSPNRPADNHGKGCKCPECEGEKKNPFWDVLVGFFRRFCKDEAGAKRAAMIFVGAVVGGGVLTIVILMDSVQAPLPPTTSTAQISQRYVPHEKTFDTFEQENKEFRYVKPNVGVAADESDEDLEGRSVNPSRGFWASIFCRGRKKSTFCFD